MAISQGLPLFSAELFPLIEKIRSLSRKAQDYEKKIAEADKYRKIRYLERKREISEELELIFQRTDRFLSPAGIHW